MWDFELTPSSFWLCYFIFWAIAFAVYSVIHILDSRERKAHARLQQEEGMIQRIDSNQNLTVRLPGDGALEEEGFVWV